MKFHLAQANMARMRYPLENLLMREFKNQIAKINQLAEGSLVFVWRLQDDSGDVQNAVSRIHEVRSEGESAEAFTFRKLYPQPVPSAAAL